MVLKIDFAITKEDFEHLWAIKTAQDLLLFRHDMLRKRKRFFNGQSLGYFSNLEIPFSRLLEKTGNETVPVKKMQSFRKQYLKGVKSIWDSHYHNLRSGLLPYKMYNAATGAITSAKNDIWDTQAAFKLFLRIKKGTLKKPDEEILIICQAAKEDNFTLFLSLYKSFGCNWFNGSGVGWRMNPIIKKIEKALK